MPPVYIGEVIISPERELKLRTLRGLTGAYVRASVEWPARPIRTVWHDHPEHGRRLIVVTAAGARFLKTILQPVDITDGTWLLRTCLLADRADNSQERRA